MWHKFSKGFTLLELLVVISIIGILVAMASVAYSNAQRKGRDAKRVGDMKSIQNAIEQYRSNNTAYTTNCSSMATTGGLAVWPTDPQGGSYTTNTCTTTDYCVCADLEGNKGNFSDNNCGSPVNGTGDYFCVSELQ